MRGVGAARRRGAGWRATARGDERGRDEQRGSMPRPPGFDLSHGRQMVRARAVRRRPYVSTGRRPPHRAGPVVSVERGEDGRECLDRAARDRVDDQLDVPDALARVRPQDLGDSSGGALERRGLRLRVVALDRARCRRAGGRGPRPCVRRGRVAPDVATGVVDACRAARATRRRRVADVGEPRVPGLDVGHRDPQHPRPVGADDQRRTTRPRSARQQLAVACLVEAPVEVDRAVAGAASG